ncbi:MAG: diguanylate cyclase [Ferrimicrobium sp.]
MQDHLTLGDDEYEPTPMSDESFRRSVGRISAIVANPTSLEDSLAELQRLTDELFEDTPLLVCTKHPGFGTLQELWRSTTLEQTLECSLEELTATTTGQVVTDNANEPCVALIVWVPTLDQRRTTILRGVTHAIANTMGQDHAKQRWQRASALAEVIATISSIITDPQMPAERWWEEIANGVTKYLGTGESGAMLFDSDGTTQLITNSPGLPAELGLLPFEEFTQWMRHHGKPVVVGDFRAKVAQPPDALRSTLARPAFGSLIGVPILQDSTVIGLLGAISSETYDFDPSDVDALTQIANLGVVGAAIRHQYKVEELATERTHLLGHAVANLEEGVIATDEAGLLTFANPSFATLAGRHLDELIGQHYSNFLDPDARRTLAVALGSYKPDRTIRALDIVLRQPNGTPIATSAMIHYIDNLSGGADGYIVTIRNNTEHHLQIQDWEWHAEHDSLTGMLNRRGLARALSTGLVTVIYIDLDRFKSVNDTFGHLVGDQVLSLVAQRIVANIKPTDQLARVGGDEFIVISPPPPSQRTLRRIGYRLATAIGNTPMEIGDYRLHVTASIGATVCDQSLGLDELLSRADQAMYQAKVNAAPVSVTRDPKFGPVKASWLTPEMDVVAALSRRGHDRVHLLVRPWSDLRDNQTVAQDYELTFHAPKSTHPLRDAALQRHLGAGYNQLLLHHLLAGFQERSNTPIGISPIIAHYDLARRIRHLSAAHLIKPSRLIIEFDAHELMSPTELAWACIQADELRKLGCRIALRWGDTEGGELAILSELVPDQLQVRVPALGRRRPTEHWIIGLCAFCKELNVELAITDVASTRDLAILKRHAPHFVQLAEFPTNATTDPGSIPPER